MDLPAILRAEVAAALMAKNLREGALDLYQGDRDYLTARYGPAPDNERSPSPDNDSREALRAPTFTREAEAALADLCREHHYINSCYAYLASREGR